MNSVRDGVRWSMAAGLIPFAVLDMAVISSVQMNMLAEVSKIYGIEFRKNRAKALAGSLIGSLVPGVVASAVGLGLLKALPLAGYVLGSTAMVLFSGASAWALGKVFIQHFESGGTFLDFNLDEGGKGFKARFEDGRKAAATLGFKPCTPDCLETDSCSSRCRIRRAVFPSGH